MSKQLEEIFNIPPTNPEQEETLPIPVLEEVDAALDKDRKSTRLNSSH